MASPGQQLFEFPFAGGVNQAFRDELADPSQVVLNAENIRQQKRGGFGKRYGFSVLGGLSRLSGSRSAGYKLIANNTVTAVSDGSVLDVYDPQSTAWVSLNRLPEADCRIIDVASLGTSAWVEDVDYNNGYFALSMYVSDGTNTYGYAAILNAATGAVVRAPEQVDSTNSICSPLLAVQDNYFIFIRGSANNLKAWYLDTTSTSTINTGWVAFGANIATDISGGPFLFGVQSITDSSPTRVAVAYWNTSGGASQMTVKTFNVASGVLQSATAAAGTVTAVDVCGSATDTLWVAFAVGNKASLLGLSATSLSTVKATKADIITSSSKVDRIGMAPSTTTGKGRMIVWENTSPVHCYMCGFQTSAGAAATDGSQSRIPTTKLMGRPFLYGGRYYAPLSDGHDNTTITLCDFTADQTWVRPVGNPLPLLGVADQYGKGKLQTSSSSAKRYFGLTCSKSSVGTGAALAEFDFGSSQRWKPTSFGNTLFLTGGVLSTFDFVRVAESGFLYRPPQPTTSTSGTGITAVTGWKYVCIYEEVDASGNWCVSGISDPSVSTGAVTNKTVTVTTNPLSITNRLTSSTSTSQSVRVAFYRTLDGGSPPYYRLGTSLNATSGTTVTFADATSDTTLSANAKLYSPNLSSSVGGSLDRRAPPALTQLVSYNGMLVGASGTTLWYSGQYVDGEAPWFNPVFQVPVEGTGPIYGLGTQDGTLFVFKRLSIWTVSGDPPSDNGAIGGLGTPRRLGANSGCIDGRSIVATAKGIFFQSDRGIELLNRAGAVEWIGEPIRDTVAIFPIVTAATLDDINQVVYFELAASESANQVSGNGRTLVYDLTLDRWVSIDRRANSSGTADAPAQSGALIYTGTAYRYGWLGTDGRVYYEDTTTYLDPGSTWVTMKVETAWIKMGLQTLTFMNRALLLAKWATGHDLTCSWAYDYNTSYASSPRTYSASEIVTLTGLLPNQQLELRPNDDARAQSFRLKIQDVTPSSGSVGTGQGATWVGLTFEHVPQTGAYPLPDGAR